MKPTGVLARCDHCRQVEDLGKLGVREHGVSVVHGVAVTRELVKTLLLVNDDEHRRVFVEALVREIVGHGGSRQGSAGR